MQVSGILVCAKSARILRRNCAEMRKWPQKNEQFIKNPKEEILMKEVVLNALVVEPGIIPYEEYIVNDSEMMQFFLSEVEPYTCRIGLMRIEENVCILYNKDAESYNLSPNRRVSNKTIYGTFYIVGIDYDNRLTSLNDDEIEMYRNI